MQVVAIAHDDVPTIVTVIRPLARIVARSSMPSIEAELKRICSMFGPDARWELRYSPARGGGWVATAVVTGPCDRADSSPSEAEHGAIYRAVASDVCWTRDEAESELLLLLKQVCR